MTFHVTDTMSLDAVSLGYCKFMVHVHTVLTKLMCIYVIERIYY